MKLGSADDGGWCRSVGGVSVQDELCEIGEGDGLCERGQGDERVVCGLVSERVERWRGREEPRDEG